MDRDTGRELLPRLGRRGWEGWFVITIGEPGAEVRWTKTHLFRSKRRPGTHPIAALEGLTTPAELVTYVATADRIYETRCELAPEAIEPDRESFSIVVADELRIDGLPPTFHMMRKVDEAEIAIDLDLTIRDRIDWARWSPIVQYFGLHSRVAGSLTLSGEVKDLAGLGVLEHAWGINLPFDPNHGVREAWHWDVLSFDEDAPCGAAALSLPLPLFGNRGVRAAGRIPGQSFGRLRGFRVEYLAFDTSAHPASGHVVTYPTRWIASLHDRNTLLSYEARATTPLAHAAPDGGFLGFAFDADYRGRRLAGTGFTECGNPHWVERSLDEGGDVVLGQGR
jgi:hypothetical protein